jgi:class 3 adenylate cyclase/tetratricopeptide (TPR) repeat protein
MTCPQCRADNPATVRFCGECGAALGQALCDTCRTALPPQARFCPACGVRITSSAIPARFGTPDTYTPRRLADKILTDRRALEGERKQVTVLFADLRDSMELIVDRDPENARLVLDEVIERMMEAVHRFDGTVNQVMGDGIMALFGAPVAHEDHAIRACYAALRMQENLQRWAEEARRDLGIAVAIRIGLNSGDVIVRAIGSDLYMDYSAVGRTTHLAARFEQMASPGTILLSRETFVMAEGFIETRPLGPMTVRGINEPIELHELVGATAVRTRFQRAVTQGFTRFVGRDTEVQALRRAAAEARRGHGRVVAVVGDAGIGKSRLVWELSRSLGADGWLVLEGRCLSYGRSSAYVPVTEMLRTYFDIQPSDDGTVIADRIAARLLALDPNLTVYLSALQALLDAPVEDTRWRQLDPLERRRETVEAVRRLVLRESQARPVLMLVDDVHWIDAESQALLDVVVEAVRNASVLVLVGYRPEYEAPWSGRAHCEKLRLEPLSTQGVDLLLDALLGNGQDLAALRGLLVDRTEGNPFFIEESVVMLATEGVLDGERGRYSLSKSPTAISIPPTVQALLASRIDQLEAGDKRLLEAAAVVGKDVPLWVLEAIGDLPEQDLRAGLIRLQEAEFIYEARLFPEIEYVFKHPLTHEVAYGGLPSDRRRTMHARVVAAMEEQVEPARLDERVGTLAYHAFRGGLWDQAVTWLRRAGVKAALRSASDDAVARFEQALEAVAQLPSTRVNLELAMDLRFELRNPLFLLADFPRALTVLEEVTEMAEASDDRERLGRACAFTANAHFMLGNVEQGLRLAERARLIGDQLGDAAVLAFAWCHLGQLHYVTGDHASAVSSMATCVKWLGADAVRRRRNIVQLYGVVAECFVALAEASRGRFLDAVAAAHRCAGIADESNAPFYRALASWALGAAHLTRGDVKPALTLLERARAACDAADIHSIRPWIAADLGLAVLLDGRGGEAIAVLEGAVADAASLHLFAGQSLRLERLAQAYRATGRAAQETCDTAARAVETAARHGEHGFLASSLRTQGQIEMEIGDLKTSAMHLEDALALAGRYEMAPLVARCHYDLATLRRRAGDSAAAERDLDAAIALFRDLDMPWWLAQAESLAL